MSTFWRGIETHSDTAAVVVSQLYSKSAAGQLQCFARVDKCF